MPKIGNEHRQRCDLEDRQRPAVIGLEHVEELEDGGVLYKFHMDEASKDKILEEGLKLILACAVSKVDLADVYAWIETQEETDEEP